MTTPFKFLTHQFCKVFKSRIPYTKLCLLLYWVILSYSPSVLAEESDEYILKAAFLYNFSIFTTWPDRDIDHFNLCLYGSDPFGKSIDSLLSNKRVHGRAIIIHRTTDINHLHQCQLVFISRSEISNLKKVIDTLKDKPILTVADSPGANQLGVVLNMAVKEDQVTFEANLKKAREVGLNLSSQLLRLATKVLQ